MEYHSQPQTQSSGAVGQQQGSLRRRKVAGHQEDEHGSTYDEKLQDVIDKTSRLKIGSRREKSATLFFKTISPLILTAVSAFVRIYRIENANKVIWDEAHFGKFGSQYIKREYYFDVHPPLGKLLVGLSGYLAGYDGTFKFDSGEEFPESMNYVFMRLFNCFFGILVTPIAYRTAFGMGYDQWTCWLISLMVAFEQISLTLSKFVLLDSMLMFFVAFTFFGLLNIRQETVAKTEFSRSGLKWFFLTGLSVGCVCSIKWVGLFITALVGLYTAHDLLMKLFEVLSSKTTWRRYISHWGLRILTLIVVPTAIYMSAFKVHFAVLNHSGLGDSSTSSLLQASLIGNDLHPGPRSVAYGSRVTIRSQGLSPNLLHSHNHKYPEGSQEQQVTTYGYKDVNNEFIIENPSQLSKSPFVQEEKQHVYYIHDLSTITLKHAVTNCSLAAYPIKAPLTKSSFEVACSNIEAGSATSDQHEWVLEVRTQEKSPSPKFQNEDPFEVHPISTGFRLKHKKLGCYLASTGREFPPWGFRQGEVVCKNSIFSKDKTTWWNVENHLNHVLGEPDEAYVPPRPNFWKEFVVLNYGMMVSNNALIPDPDKFDKLSSEWWEWPILRTGLRMSGWGDNDFRFFLMGNPLVTWLSTAALVVSVPYLLFILFAYKRQKHHLGAGGAINSSQASNLFVNQLILPLGGWAFNLIPFIAMKRVKYLHHYVPALYFAIFVCGYMVDRSTHNRAVPKRVSQLVYMALYFSIVWLFWKYKDFASGMEDSTKNYFHLRLLDTWMI
ncbi:uncharacterized protein LODBEIA_P52540 [Lodderomyces beijingensis]|uniref:Dolichyl-phosphate-mannose--protein mannosyltransferase n=1 Tax=Lodderomyces beijingensis TaxID=1775926 RepID=A0ABP0ZV07_9ASCO